MKPVLLYLHGFNSSPGSAKAQQMAAWVAANRPDIEVVIPAQPNTPAQAWAAIEQTLAGLQARHGEGLRLGAVGSSLGGFMATRVSELYGCRAALIHQPGGTPPRALVRLSRPPDQSLHERAV